MCPLGRQRRSPTAQNSSYRRHAIWTGPSGPSCRVATYITNGKLRILVLFSKDSGKIEFRNVDSEPWFYTRMSAIFRQSITQCLSVEVSKWAATWQNQQSDCAPSEDSDQPGHPPSKCTAKTLIRVGGCPGWSESSVGAHSFCWLCHVVAQMKPLRQCRRPFEGSALYLKNSRWSSLALPIEPRHEKTCLRVLRPGKTQSGLRSHRS